MFFLRSCLFSKKQEVEEEMITIVPRSLNLHFSQLGETEYLEGERIPHNRLCLVGLQHPVFVRISENILLKRKHSNFLMQQAETPSSSLQSEDRFIDQVWDGTTILIVGRISKEALIQLGRKARKIVWFPENCTLDKKDKAVASPNITILDNLFLRRPEEIAKLFWDGCCAFSSAVEYVYVNFEDQGLSNKLGKLLEATIDKLQPIIKNLYIVLPDSGCNYAMLIENMFSNFEINQTISLEIELFPLVTEIRYGNNLCKITEAEIEKYIQTRFFSGSLSFEHKTSLNLILKKIGKKQLLQALQFFPEKISDSNFVRFYSEVVEQFSLHEFDLDSTTIITKSAKESIDFVKLNKRQLKKSSLI